MSMRCAISTCTGARPGRAPVQAERAVALRQGRGGEGAEQVGGVHGGLFWVVLKWCGFVRVVDLCGGLVLGLGLRYFLISSIFRSTWKVFRFMRLLWCAWDMH